MLPTTLIVIAALIALFVIIIATRPSEFSVARTGTITAPAGVVFEQVDNLHNWEAWSPWAKLDPAARTTYEGPPAGPGAVFKWDGNNKIGQGGMTITESRPAELVRFRLDFLRPFKGTNIAEFTFKTNGNQTVVTWTMSGKLNFMTKAIGLFISCDKMIGCQFEKGLADMKTVAESAAGKSQTVRA